MAERYSQIVKNLITEYLSISYEYDLLKYKTIIDLDSQDYIVIIQGLDKKSRSNIYRIYDLVAHLKINNNKVIIYRDKIENGLKKALVELGIPSDKIELFTNEKQPFTQYVFNFKQIYDSHQHFFTAESTFEHVIINPEATIAELNEIFKIKHEKIGSAIAQHTNASPYLLVNLFGRFPVEVLNNPVISLLLLEQPDFLEQLYNSFTDIFIQGDIKIPSFFIEWAVNHKLEEIRSNVAQSQTIPERCLKKLLDDESCLVIQELYKNPILDLDSKNKLNEKRLLLEKNCPYKYNDNFCGCQQKK